MTIEENYSPLLGRQTAIDLGIMIIGANVSVVSSKVKFYQNTTSCSLD